MGYNQQNEKPPCLAGEKKPCPCPSRPRWWSSSSSLWSENANIMQSSGFIAAGDDGGRRISALIHGLIPALGVKMWTAVFCSFCFFLNRLISKAQGKQLISIKMDLSTALITLPLGLKPITASRAWLWPRVWFMFTVNRKQSEGARLPAVCMQSGCRVVFLSSSAKPHICLCFRFFSKLELKEMLVNRSGKVHFMMALLKKLKGGRPGGRR